MYVLLVRCEAAGRRSRIHVVNDEGVLDRSTATVQEALRWLVEQGEGSVVAMTDDGPELFLIEPCEGLQMTLPSLSLRRASHGLCGDPPGVPGLSPDPTLRARTLEDRQETRAERRRRRATWVRRATGPAANDTPR